VPPLGKDRTRAEWVARPSLLPLSRWYRAGLLVAGAVIVTVAAAVLVSDAPILTAITVVVGIPLAIGVVMKSEVRLIAVIVGALLVFQSTSDQLKFAYLGLAVLCVAVSFIALMAHPDPETAVFRPLLIASLVVSVYIGFSAFVAVSNGATLTNWFRDVLPYLLMALLPVVGLDASRSVRPSWMEALIGVLGVVAAIGVALDWLNRRGVSSLDIGRILLSTFSLVALSFALGITRAGLGPKRLLWMIAVTVMAVAMLLSGSRTNLLLFVAIVAVAGSAKYARVPIRRMVFTGVWAIATTAVAVVVIGGVVIHDPAFLQGRVRSTLLVLSGNAGADMSYVEREAAYSQAWSAFQLHPVLGTGPGHLYPSGFFGMDASNLILAKWGVAGTVVLLAFLITVVVCIRRSRTLVGPLPIHTAAFGWGVVLVALLPFGPWIEDKGFSLAVTVLITAVAASARPRPETARVGSRGAVRPVSALQPAPADPLGVARRAPSRD
jgi:hypothetical protein